MVNSFYLKRNANDYNMYDLVQALHDEQEGVYFVVWATLHSDIIYDMVTRDESVDYDPMMDVLLEDEQLIPINLNVCINFQQECREVGNNVI